MSTFQDHNKDLNDENFEELLEHSMNRRDDFAVGTRVEGKIVFISNENVFVDISGKSEAVVSTAEFRNSDGALSVKVGDAINAYVVSVGGGEISLTTSIGRGTMNPSLMQMAYRESIPVYGTIIEAVKGGYSISVGGTRCFCPFSQLESRSSSDKNAIINKSFLFKIIEYKEKGKNIILSRTAMQEEQRKQTEETLKATLKEGDTITGPISSIRDFGIFIDIGGLDALIPKSEISWSRYSDIGAYQIGENITAFVKTIDWPNKRLTLSIRDLTPEPWEHISNYTTGQTITGRVVNIIKNGAFIEIEPGLDGFVHISRMSYLKKVNKPEEIISAGDQVNARIININAAEKKISLELVLTEGDPWKESGDGIVNSLQTVTVEDVKSSGLNVRLANGMLGFIPRGELSAASESELQKKYSAGQEMQVAVLRFEQDNRKLIMSEKEASKMEERKDYEKFIKKESATQSTSLGSLLKNKFDDIQKRIDK